jgi:hypothetical protein
MTTRGVRLPIFFVALLALLALVAVPALAAEEPEPNPNVRIVRLSLAQGDVQVDRNVGVGWEQAINNMPLPSGASVYAADDSKAEIELEDGSTIRLAGPAQVALADLSLTADGATVNDVEIDSGLVYINAGLLSGTQFHIQDANGTTFAITEPSVLRFKVDEQVASLAVMDGEVEALDTTGYTLIRSGQSYNYILGQPASAVLLDKIVPENEDAWNEQRNAYEQQYTAAAAESSGGEGAYDYGEADLSYYGSYQDIPGYGEAWQPYDVAPDWSPFDNGAWCYYPDWGWTFVSAYPWGWEPFYFGNWFYVNGRGWFWHHGRHHELGPRGLHHGPGRGPMKTGFHPQPRLGGGRGAAGTASLPRNFSLPRPPASDPSHRTVAVAGSNLRVGPVRGAHALLPGGSAFTGPSGTGVSARSITSNLARPGSMSLPARPEPTAPARLGGGFGVARPGASALGPRSSLARPTPAPRSFITGRPGSYVVHGPAARANGFELNRPPAEFGEPRTYAHSAPHVYTGHVYTGSPAPRSFSPAPRSFSPAPRSFSMPVEHAMPVEHMAPPAMNFAPHVSSGFGGGGFRGGSFGAPARSGGFNGAAIGGGGGFRGGGVHR